MASAIPTFRRAAACLALSAAALALAGCFNTSLSGISPTVTLRAPGSTWQAADASGTSLTVRLAMDSSGNPGALISAGIRLPFGSLVAGAFARANAAFIPTDRVLPSITVTTSGILTYDSGQTNTLYHKPADLLLSTRGGAPVTSTAGTVGVTIPYAFGIYEHKAATATTYAHYLGAEYAALVLRYGAAAGTVMYRAGNVSPASYVSRSTLAANYVIPVGGAYGHLSDHTDATEPQYLLHNTTPGLLSVNFANSLASLNVRFATHYESAVYYNISDWELTLSADKRSFSSNDCPSAGGSLTTPCGGSANASYVDAANNTITSSHNNSVTAATDKMAEMSGGFYGDKAQEFALAIRHTLGDLLFHGGALGRNTRVVPPTLWQAADASGSTSAISVVANAASAPISVVSVATNAPNATIALGAVVTGSPDRAYIPHGGINTDTATIAASSVAVDGKTLYQKPADLHVHDTSGAIVPSGGRAVAHTFAILQNGTGATATYAHYLQAEHVALFLRYGDASTADSRLNTRMYHVGNVADFASALNSRSFVARYTIPVGAAYGHLSGAADADATYFLYNRTAGMLDVDFATKFATLNLRFDTEYSSDHLFALNGWQLTIADNKDTFSNHACRSGGGDATSNCAGVATIQYGSGASNAHTYNNSAATASTLHANVHGRFYGARAQEFAMAISHRNGSVFFNGGALGRNTGATPPTLWQAADASGVTDAISLIAVAGAPVSVITVAAHTVAALGATVTGFPERVYIPHGGINTDTATINAGSVAADGKTLYTKPADLRVDASGAIITDNTGGNVVTHTFAILKDGTGNAATYAHYLRAEHAALLLRYDVGSNAASRLNTRMYHIGSIANFALADTSRTLIARYTIPVGAAYGHLSGTGNNDATYFLHNRTAGMLDVNFSKRLAALSLKFDTAYSTDHLFAINGWQMVISDDKRTFSNSACPSAGGSSANNCIGTATLQYGSGAGNTHTYNNSAATAATRHAKVHGRFYGAGAQELALAISHRNGAVFFHGGAIGRNTGIVPPSTLWQAADASGSTNAISVVAHANGTPLDLVSISSISGNSTIDLGAAIIGTLSGSSDNFRDTPRGGIDNASHITIGAGKAETEDKALYTKPADLRVHDTSGAIVPSGGRMVAHTFGILKSGTGDNAAYAHYLRAEHAALFLRYYGGTVAANRTSTRMYHIGSVFAPAAAAKALIARYTIPVGAAYGHLSNSNSNNQIYFVHNSTAGALDVNFNTKLATLSLQFGTEYSTDHLFALNGWQLALPDSKDTFSNSACPSAGGAATSNCGGAVSVQYGSGAGNAHTTNNNAATTATRHAKVYGRFYGTQAQEFALAINYRRDDIIFHGGALGRSTGAPPPPPVPLLLASAADGSTNTIGIVADDNGIYVSLVSIASTVTFAFGSAIIGTPTDRLYVPGNRPDGRPTATAGVDRVSVNDKDLYRKPSDMTVDPVSGTISGTGRTFSYTFGIQQINGAFASNADYAHHLKGEYVALFMRYHPGAATARRYLTTVYHVGSVANFAPDLSSRSFAARYTIPIGGAYGHIVAAPANQERYILFNHAAGTLDVDFGKKSATLNLKFDSEFSGGLFYQMHDWEFPLADDSRTFSNSACPSGGGSSAINCGGSVTIKYAAFAGSHVNTVTSDANVYAKMHGRFYGAHAQEFGLAIEHKVSQIIFHGGILGRNTGAAPPATLWQAVDARGSTDAISVVIDASGELIELVSLTNTSTIALGASLTGSSLQPRDVPRGALDSGDVITIAAGKVETDNKTLYAKPGDLTAHNTAGTIITTGSGTVIAHTFAIFKSGSGNAAAYAHYLRAERAALFLRYDAANRLNTRMYYIGSVGADFASADTSRSNHARYTIPVGAAYGHLSRSNHEVYLMHNRTAGMLDVNFNTKLATLNLRFDTAYNANYLFALNGWQFAIADNKDAFSNSACPSAGGAATSNCGGTISVQYGSGASNTHTLANSAATAATRHVKIHGRFYGSNAQEFALAINFLRDGLHFHGGALGRNTGAVPPSTLWQATDARGVANVVSAIVDASGAPFKLVSISGNSTVALGAAVTGTPSDKTYIPLAGAGADAPTVNASGVVVGDKTLYAKPADLKVNTTGAITTGSGTDITHTFGIRQSGTGAAAAYAHYLQAERAALLLRYDAGDRTRTRMYHIGSVASFTPANTGRSFLARYTIPVGAAYGHLSGTGGADAPYFLYNRTAGMLDVNFGGARPLATLSLVFSTDYSDDHLFAINGWQLGISDDKQNLSSTPCPSGGGIRTTDCAGTATLQYGSSNTRTFANSDTRNANTYATMHGRFYGAQAQEFALAIHHQNVDIVFHGGAIGRNTGTVPPSTLWQAADARAATGTISVVVHTNGTPLHLVSISGSSTIVLGTAVTEGSVFIPKLGLSASLATADVNNVQSENKNLYQKPADLRVNTTGAIVASGGRVVAYKFGILQSGTGAATRFVHYLRAEHAALFLRYHGEPSAVNNKATYMYHIGSVANFAPALSSRDDIARYIIPVGAAYGHLSNHGNAVSAYFLYNRTPGALDVNFSNSRATLNLKFDTAYDDAMYDIKDWQLALTSGNKRTFGNNACPSAGGDSTSNCGGIVSVQAPDHAVTTSHSNSSSANRARYFGRFYGTHAQEFALAIRHTLNALLFNGGALGRSSGAPPPPPVALWQAGNASRVSNEIGIAVSVGTPISVVTLGGSRTTGALGAAVSGSPERIYIPHGGINTPTATVVAGGVQVDDKALYTKPANLNVNATGAIVSSGGTAVTHAFGILKTGTGADALYAHYLRAEYAALILRYNAKSEENTHNRNMAVMYHMGSVANFAPHATGRNFVARYLIPVGAAYGHLSGTFGSNIGGIYFLHNRTAGALDADFANSRAALNLKLDTAHGDASYELRGWQLSLQSGKDVFDSNSCPSSTTNQSAAATSGCGGIALYNFPHTHFGTLTGVVTNSILATVGNSNAPNDANIGGRFYGSNAQEFALAISHRMGNSISFNGGAIGRNSGATPPTLWQATDASGAADAISLIAAAGAPVSVITVASNAAAPLGAAVNGNMSTFFMPKGGVNNSIITANADDVQVDDKTLYEKPADLRVDNTSGTIVASGGKMVTHAYGILKTGSGAAARFAHYLRAEHAALLLRYRGGAAGNRLNTRMYHIGNPANFTPALSSRNFVARYTIPVGAAYGHLNDADDSNSYYFLYNRSAGTLNVNFASKLAVLDLLFNTDYSANHLFELKGLQMAISDDKRTFSNTDCSSAGGTSTSNCGGTFTVRYGSSNPRSFSNSGTRSASSIYATVHGRFYGAQAQEFALAINHRNASLYFHGGALGRSEGPPPLTTWQAANASGETNVISIVLDNSGAFVTLISLAGPTAVALGNALTGEADSVWDFPRTGVSPPTDKVTIDANGVHAADKSFYLTPTTTLRITGTAGTIVAGTTGGTTLTFTFAILKTGEAGTDATYAHYLQAEYAALFLRYDGITTNDGYTTTRMYHIGSIANHTPAAAAKTLIARYFIPAGAAYGHLANNNGGRRFLQNRIPGELNVNFNAKLATLNLLFDTAYSDDHLFALNGWQLALPDSKDTFSNSACPSGGGSSTSNCGGTILVKNGTGDVNSHTYLNSAATAATRHAKVHGRFYGAHAQEFALAINYRRGALHFHGGALGRNTGAPPAPTIGQPNQVVQAADPEGNAYSIIFGPDGVPTSYVSGGTSAATTAVGSQPTGTIGSNSDNSAFPSQDSTRTGFKRTPGGIQFYEPNSDGTDSIDIMDLYNRPPTLCLSEAGGTTMATCGNAGKILTPSHFFFNSSGTYVHYLGLEYSAFAVIYRGNHGFPTVIHGGVRTPTAHLATLGASNNAIYDIPIGGAFGRMRYNNNFSVFISNPDAGKVSVNFASGIAKISISMISTEENAGNHSRYRLDNWEVTLSSDKQSFTNHGCPSSGGDATSDCGGTSYLKTRFDPDTAVENDDDAPNTHGADMNVYGIFYGSEAQEVAIGVRHYMSGGRNPRVIFGMIGRKQNPTSNSPSNDAGGNSGGNPFASAEYAAFAAMDSGDALPLMVGGELRTSQGQLSQMTAATYRIGVGKAGGWHTSAAGVRTLLESIGSANRLQVDFAKSLATLHLSVQSAAGAHGYELSGVGMQLSGSGAFSCKTCAGTISGSGALSPFSGGGNVEIRGALYGGAAERAAAHIRHTVSGAGTIDLGMIGEKE